MLPSCLRLKDSVVCISIIWISVTSVEFLPLISITIYYIVTDINGRNSTEVTEIAYQYLP